MRRSAWKLEAYSVTFKSKYPIRNHRLRDSHSITTAFKFVYLLKSSPATRQSCSVDVIIVGAGLSGLQAARLVQEAGLTCIVLEAIGRVGGKTRTVRSAETNSGFKDIGAAWLNDTSQSNMFALMKELKLTAVVQRAEGKDVMLSKDGQVELVPHGDSSPASDEDAALLATVFAKVQELVEEDIESPSAAEKARKLDHLTVADFGEEISGSNV
ncbi:hypothetical protein IWX50DRAFT_135372 [Phyllosticta citricarpa]